MVNKSSHRRMVDLFLFKWFQWCSMPPRSFEDVCSVFTLGDLVTSTWQLLWSHARMTPNGFQGTNCRWLGWHDCCQPFFEPSHQVTKIYGTPLKKPRWTRKKRWKTEDDFRIIRIATFGGPMLCCVRSPNGGPMVLIKNGLSFKVNRLPQLSAYAGDTKSVGFCGGCWPVSKIEIRSADVCEILQEPRDLSGKRMISQYGNVIF